MARASNYPSSSSEHLPHLRPGSSARLGVSGSGLPAQVWVWWRYLPWAGLGWQQDRAVGAARGRRSSASPAFLSPGITHVLSNPGREQGKSARPRPCSSPAALSRSQRALEQQCWAARAPGTTGPGKGWEWPSRPSSTEHPLSAGRAQGSSILSVQGGHRDRSILSVQGGHSCFGDSSEPQP